MKKLILTISVLLSFATMAYAVPCAVSDMQLNGFNADACSGPNPDNDNVTLINGLNGLFAGNSWTEIAKDDGPGVADTGSIDGVTFTVKATTGKSGTWDLTWTGSALPATVDLVAVLKGAGYWSAFLFDNELLLAPGTNLPDDSWKITFTTPNGNNLADLSHLTLYGRDVIEQHTPPPVPEPGTIILLGAGLLGLAAYGRKRIQK